MEQTAAVMATKSDPWSTSSLLSYSPVLRIAEDLFPGGAAVVLFLFAASAAVVLQSWGAQAAKRMQQPASRAPADAKQAAAEAHGRRRSPQCALAITPDGRRDKWDSQWRTLLPPLTYASLRTATTDPPNLPAEEGGLDTVEDDGVFVCAGCDTPLYDNDFRFEAGCGWPCFYTCLDKAVRERQDDDGTRMELICNACNGHLGHIFRGERWGLPEPAERHCVNSRSLRFIPLEPSAGAADVEPLAHAQPPLPMDDVE